MKLIKILKFLYKNFYDIYRWIISYGDSNKLIKKLDGTNLSVVLSSDCDHAENNRHKKILTELGKEGIKVTIAVFVKIDSDDSDLSKHCTIKDTRSLYDNKFLDTVIATCFKYKHEIAFHGFSQISNTREEFLFGLEEFKRIIGYFPKIYIEHGGKYGHHRPSLCKKETLLYLGSKENSKYYVKDLLQKRFKAVWAEHDFLEDLDKFSLNQIFYEKDGIIRFKRQRASKIKHSIKKDLSSNNSLWQVPYTHFNYDGYPISTQNILERWDYLGYIRVKNYLKKLKKTNSNFLTVSEALECWQSAK